MSHYALSSVGTNPLSLAFVKSSLKITTTADDAFLTMLMSAVLFFGERYTGRDFRNNSWTTLHDEFSDRIVLRKTQLRDITSVRYWNQDTVSAQILVDSSVYYAKVEYGWGELVLKTDQEWPTDVDDREAEHRIEIIFRTLVSNEHIDAMKQAMIMHITYLYQNRGDCCEADAESVRASGAYLLYDQFRIARI